MQKVKVQVKVSDVLPHFLAIVVFLIVTLIFFSPVFFENKALDQQDIQQHIGSSKSLRDFRDATGEEGLWAPSMFSGMPAYLVNLQWSDGVVVTMKKVLTLFLPHPVRNIFASFICYYILLLAFRVRPYLAIGGALAFGLSSYIIIGLSAGHNARIGAIAFMPLVMAGIHLVFTNRRILGFGVTAAGLAFQLRENHLQITYYLMLIVLAYGLVQLVIAYREKQLKDFFTSVGVLIPAVIIAAATFFGQFWAITEYTRYTIRGASELQKPGQNAVEGTSKEWAFQYNYGIWEPMTLLIPQIYGGSSTNAFVSDEKSDSYKALASSSDNQLANQLANYTRAYWGPQSFTLGPYYAGAIIVFLFVLGILFAERKYVYWLVTISVLSLMLSWGDSFSTFNYLMFDYFPGYNKFRSFSFGLIMILFSMPLLGMLGLEKFLTLELTKQVKTRLIIAAGATGGLCVFIFLFAGMVTAVKAGESQLPGWFLHALESDRQALIREDAFRSAAFILAIFIMLFFSVPKKAQVVFFAFLALMITLDISIVDKRYFTKDNYQRKRSDPGFVATAADEALLKDKSYYRVYNISPEESWGLNGRSSYFHNSLNGYHGAKMRRYQDLYDSCISRETQELVTDAQAGHIDFKKYGVLNMLNTKYIVYGPGADNIIPNNAANGPAWFVNEVATVNSPTEELRKVEEVNTRRTAVIDMSKFKVAAFNADSLSSIKLVEQKPYLMKYESQSSANGVAVFSEIYYPKGWHATIDGAEVSILRADYVLRALEVPAGKHVIEFKFEPKPYIIGNKITIASSWILLLVVLGSIGWSFKKSE